MLYFIMDRNSTSPLYVRNVVEVVEQLTNEQRDANHDVSRHDFSTFADAEHIAASANKLNDGHTYIATDAGDYVSPRYDVKRVPKVGDDVSYTFNGDYYPCGKIVSVGNAGKMIVKTDTGAVFYRRKLTGTWLKKGGTWALVKGTHKKWNESF